MNDYLFYANLIVHYVMLAGIAYSIANPVKRIWPPPKKQSWQFLGSWFLFYTAIVLTVILAFLSWNTWFISTEIRYFIGIPISLLGGMFACWGISSLGLKNTSGSAGGFIEKGPYLFTRNPQYLGDITLFIGLTVVANSLYVAISLILHSIIFLITPLAEELWLEEQYRDKYIYYKSKIPRYL